MVYILAMIGNFPYYMPYIRGTIHIGNMNPSPLGRFSCFRYNATERREARGVSGAQAPGEAPAERADLRRQMCTNCM